MKPCVLAFSCSPFLLYGIHIKITEINSKHPLPHLLHVRELFLFMLTYIYSLCFPMPYYCSAWANLNTRIGLHTKPTHHPPTIPTQTCWPVPDIVGYWNSVNSIKITPAKKNRDKCFTTFRHSRRLKCSAKLYSLEVSN